MFIFGSLVIFWPSSSSVLERMSGDTPLSLQIKQFLVKLKNRKADMQRFLNVLAIYRRNPMDTQAHKNVRGFINEDIRREFPSKAFGNNSDQSNPT